MTVGHLHLPQHDATIRWHETGQGTPLVMLPGLSMPAVSNFLGAATQPAIAPRRVLMIDYLGSGLSDRCPTHDGAPGTHAANIAAVLDHLALDHVDLFGHSMGGTVAIALALKRPDLVARLAVAESNLTPGGGVASRAIADQPQADFIATGYATMLADLRARAVAGQAFADRLASGWMQADPATLWANARALVDLSPDFEAAFFALPIPRAFLYGDRNLPKDGKGVSPDTPDPDRLRKHGVTPHAIENAGHAMHTDNPEAFAVLLADLFPA